MLRDMFPSFLIATIGLLGQPALAAEAPKLPVIHQVGVIPLQWEGEEAPYGPDPALLGEEFSRAVRESRRFRVLGDDLVAGHWNNADGREEMRDQFELDALTSLTVVPRGDTVSLVMRLMNLNLSTLLLETDSMSRAWFVQADRPQIRDRIEKLVFRTFNRLPVDVSVTSVQGAYITLSGGKEQGIEIGDHVSLVRSRIRSIHPATGAWLNFQTEPLGSAKIVEVKGHSSVAKLVELTFEGAVEVGDGAKIPAIASRLKFARLADKPLLADSGNQETIIVPPLYQGPGESPTTPSVTPEPPSATPTQPTEPSATKPTPPAHQVADGDEADEVSPWDDFSMSGVARKIIDSVTLEAGPYWWSVKGPRSASGRFPIWLLNRVYLKVTKTVFHKIKVGYGGGGMLGQTAKGNYFAYDSHARVYWEDMLMPGTFFGWWQAGGHGRFTGHAVNKEKYGGGDWVKGGGFVAVGGLLNLDDLGAADWFSEFTILPLNIGRLGYDGSRRTIESSMGWTFSLGAWQKTPPGNVQFGGSLTLSDERQTYSEKGTPRRMHYQEYSLQALARYEL